MGNITDSIIKGDMRMKNIKEIGDFFINLNEYVYATDIETNEIVYMNHKALKAYGLESIEDIKGRKCYEVLQKASVKCGMCNNSRLLPGAFEEWRYYNPVLDKYMIIKDTLIEGEGNRKYRLEIGIDISEELAQDKLIQKYRETEALVNEGLRVALAADTPDETISTLLGYIGKALSGERTYIFEKNIYGRDDNTYEWTADGIRSEKDNLQNLPPEVCANWYKCFEKGGNIVIQDIEEIKDSDPLQYDNLKRQGVHSIIAIPIYNEGNVVAFMGIGNPPLLTLKYALSILEIMGAFIISCIKRRNTIRKLENMSYKDALAIVALVLLFCLYGLYKSSTKTIVSAFIICSFNSSVSFPCSSILAITCVFLSSRLRRYLSLSSRARSCSSFNAPVTSFRYLAINGIVQPSSISLTAASTCDVLTSSSSAIFLIISIIKLHSTIYL